MIERRAGFTAALLAGSALAALVPQAALAQITEADVGAPEGENVDDQNVIIVTGTIERVTQPETQAPEACAQMPCRRPAPRPPSRRAQMASDSANAANWFVMRVARLIACPRVRSVRRSSRGLSLART